MTDRAMIDIASPQLSAAINPFGAELTHLRDADGRELMTDADPAYWTGHAPVLFPIVGELHDGTYRVNGREYALSRHGFARRSLFEVVEHEADRAVFQLIDSQETRAVYPFAFQLRIEFRLDGATLLVTATIANRSDGVMPASFGFHPAFAWPLPYGELREDHRITFDVAEPDPLRGLSQHGLVTDTPRASPLDGHELLLRDSLFEADALIWQGVESETVHYGAAQGPVLEISFPDTPNLGIWTKPGARYVCVEPWHGIADPVGFTGDLFDKPDIMTIAPGAERQCSFSVTLMG
ncbi:aldose 1-epimerase family protein [Stakelama sediminis]|uniref:Galactose mutarotase-like enzyme n=1 Tax=Stakelama sediminis TaxID=463200 RepID=A0A840Z218_9SPHN|nr:aldose 1-epimerase family protein [Stakelama sediminis]MBB5719839.1 galactose mutarotase-like enzyme [Stakelama sediminis]